MAEQVPEAWRVVRPSVVVTMPVEVLRHVELVVDHLVRSLASAHLLGHVHHDDGELLVGQAEHVAALLRGLLEPG